MARVVGRGKVQAYRVKSKRNHAALRAAVQDAWVKAVVRNSSAKALLGLPADRPLPARLRKSPYKTVRRAGADPASATLLVTLGAAGIRLGAKLAWEVWKRYVEPYLDRKLKLRAAHPTVAQPKRKKAKATKKTR
jgi:hypothetical protein